MGIKRRLVSYFSCGAASAVATKLALSLPLPAGCSETVILNFEIKEEHEDNKRFLDDCQKWFDHPIITVRAEKYSGSADEVYRKTGWLIGPKGARCTTELKRKMRHEHGHIDDLIVLGFTSGEENRLARMQKSEPELNHWPLLIERGMTKQDCLGLLERVGIKLPAMYLLGYQNNNCIGCVKGGAGYWNKIRVDFPERFLEMAKIERELGRRINKIKKRRIYLDELPPDAGNYPQEIETECGIFCQAASEETKNES